MRRMPTALNARKLERVAYLPVENNASARIGAGFCHSVILERRSS
jgi:hypothetical protein